MGRVITFALTLAAVIVGLYIWNKMLAGKV